MIQGGHWPGSSKILGVIDVNLAADMLQWDLRLSRKKVEVCLCPQIWRDREGEPESHSSGLLLHSCLRQWGTRQVPNARVGSAGKSCHYHSHFFRWSH